MARSRRRGGMAKTWLITAACSGAPRGGIPEQRVDRGQSGVAGSAAVAPLLFQVLQERADQRGVQVGEAERRRLPGLFTHEDEEEPVGVAVGRDRVRAGVLLPGQPVGEEPLQEGSEV